MTTSMGLPSGTAEVNLPPAGREALRLGWVRRMWPLLRPHSGSLVGSSLLAVLTLVLQVAVPALVGTTIDAAIADGSEPLGPFLTALVAIGLARGLLTALYRYGLFRMAYGVEAGLRTTLYRRYVQLSHSFYDRTQTGQLISRAQADVRAVQMFFTVAPLITTALLGFGLAFAVMASANVLLTLLAIAPLPLVYLVGLRLRNRLFPLSWIIQGRQAEVATVTEESVAGVRVVQSFAAEPQRVAAMALAARRLRWANVRQGTVRARMAPLLENLPRLGALAVLVYGGWLVIEGRLEIGTIIEFNAYLVMLTVPFRFLGFFLILGQRARASAERIFEVLDEVPEVLEDPDAVALPHPRGEVELVGVRFGYGQGPDVLRGVDLHVEAGEVVALVGATGSGKSTLARLLARYYDVRDGEVRLDGHDVRRLVLAELRRTVVVAPDEPFLFSSPLRDNLAFGAPSASPSDVEDVARAVDAHDFILELEGGYDTVVGERGYTLSGGQRQRVALARALLVDPAVLVLDDATSAIDVEVEARIHAALSRRRRDRTTILIAHRLSTIALADRVVFLDDGRVRATGSHAELLSTVPGYAQVFAQEEPTR